MSRPTKLIIDLHALRHNLQQIKKLAPQSLVMAMVKADAYGHGFERVALALSDADAFGVTSLEEGLILKRVGITQPIVLMEGLFSPEELGEAVRNNFQIVVHQNEQVAMLENVKLVKPIPVWVKINTGMCRLGFVPADVAAVYQRLLACSNVTKPMNWLTHFAEADDLNTNTTEKQIVLFNSLVKDFPGPRSLANSAGILAWSSAHADWVRPGIMLYGISPFRDRVGINFDLLPVMNLTAQLIAIQEIKKNMRVGYGGTWTAPEDMRIGVVSVGYGDGYPQHTSSGTPVLVNNKSCPLIGRVSMDMLTVDLRTQPEAKIGDPVILWGKGLPIEIIAAASNTSAYELVTRMTHRPVVETVG